MLNFSVVYRLELATPKAMSTVSVNFFTSRAARFARSYRLRFFRMDLQNYFGF